MIDEAGFLVGMVTSNTKHLGTGQFLPNLKYSVHAAALRPLWNLLKSSVPPDVQLSGSWIDTRSIYISVLDCMYLRVY